MKKLLLIYVLKCCFFSKKYVGSIFWVNVLLCFSIFEIYELEGQPRLT